MDIITTTIERDILRDPTAWPLLASAIGHVPGQLDAALVRGTAADIASMLHASRVAVATVEAPAQPATRVTDYYGLWGSSPLGRAADGESWRLSSGRRAGFAWVSADVLAPLISFMAGTRVAMFAFLESRQKCPVTQELLESVFDPDSERLNWGALVSEAVSEGWTAGRLIRDESVIELQVFDVPERLARLGLSDAR